MKHFIWFVLLVVGLAFLAYGLYSSPFALVHADTDVRGNAEYTNGILTVSSILFGIWAIILSNKPRRENIVEQDLFKKATIPSFYLCFGLLVLSVGFLTLAGLGIYSQAASLIFSALSCILNAVYLTIFVEHYVVAENPKT